MKVNELKIDENVLINGNVYAFKGIQKIRLEGMGKVQKIVFETNMGNRFDYKYFDISVGNKDLKIHPNGEVELK